MVLDKARTVADLLTQIVKPVQYWRKIGGSSLNWTTLFLLLVVPAAFLSTASGVAAVLLHGPYPRYSTGQSILLVVVADLIAVCALFVEAFSARLVTKFFKGRRGFDTAFAFMSFSSVPIMVFAVISPLLTSIPYAGLTMRVVFGLSFLVLLYTGTAELLEIRAKAVGRAAITLLIIALPLAVAAIVLGLVDLALLFLPDILF